MDCKYLLVVLFCVTARCVCEPGDPVMYLPALELRALDNNRALAMYPLSNSDSMISPGRFPIDQASEASQVAPQVVPMAAQMASPARQPLFHNNFHHPAQVMTTTTPAPLPVTTERHEDTKSHHNFTVTDLLDALNMMSEPGEEHEQSRAAARDEYGPRPYPPYSPVVPPFPSYPKPSYGYAGRPPAYGPSPAPAYGPPPAPAYAPPVPVPAYHEPSAYVPPVAVHHHKAAVVDLLKPVTTKVAGKISGLIGLVLALLTGSGADGIELKGFKDIVINGIVKPLLIAKGGIKSLISKLAIPVISLLLINLEVLITIWWLWDDCPEPVPYPKGPLPYSPGPAYNSYR